MPSLSAAAAKTYQAATPGFTEGLSGGRLRRSGCSFSAPMKAFVKEAARTSIITTETQAFRDFVVGTRPNSIAAKLFQDFPPFRYPTSGFQDLDATASPSLVK